MDEATLVSVTSRDAHQTAVAVNDAALAEMDDQERHPAVMRTIIAAPRLADDDPQAATVAPGEDAFPGMPLRFGLAEGEMEVLRLVDAGHGNRVIASELSISPKMASVHVSNTLAKLGVSTRTEGAGTVHRLYVLDGQ